MKYLKYFAASLTGIKKGVLPVWIGMNVMIAAIAVFAGYAGAIDPEKMPFSGIVAMTFPVWWIANVACLVINLILCRRNNTGGAAERIQGIVIQYAQL